jgi:hypothetical protein
VVTSQVIIAGLATLAVLLLIAVGRLLAKTRALATRLAATAANLQKYAPIDEIDVELARRRMSLQTETARAHRQMDEVRHEVEAAIARMREEAEAEHAGLTARLQLAREDLARAEATLAERELQAELVEAGFYQPKFGLTDAAEFADALDLVREAQKELVRQKQLLEEVGDPVPPRMRPVGRLGAQAFNAAAAAVIAAVAPDNFEASKEKLHRHFRQVNRLLEPTGLRLAAKHLDLKVKELALVHDVRGAEETARRAHAALRETMRQEEAARQAAERLPEASRGAIPRDRLVFERSVVATGRPEPRVAAPAPEGDAFDGSGERTAAAGDAGPTYPTR